MSSAQPPGERGHHPVERPRLAYMTTDPGIPPDGTKGASVHFREMAHALACRGVDLDIHMARRFQHSEPNQAVTLSLAAKSKSLLERETRLLANQSVVFDALRSRGPHDAVYERFSLFGIAGSVYARTAQIPHILEVNSPLWFEASAFRGLELSAGARGLARDTLLSADWVIAVSDVLARLLEDEGVERERIRVFHNGVGDAFVEASKTDSSKADGSRAANVPESLRGRTVLVFAGSLKPWHGIDFLLDAFHMAAKSRRLGLWIVGDGPLKNVVREYARNQRGTIVFDGAVPHESIPGILRAADIAVAPYTKESPTYFSPLKIVEAMAAGTAVLASDTEPVREIVAGNPDQPLVELFAPSCVEAFVSALHRLVDDTPRRLALAARAQRYALHRFTWRRLASELLELLGWDSTQSGDVDPSHDDSISRPAAEKLSRVAHHGTKSHVADAIGDRSP